MEIKKTKTSDEYYYCNKCKRKFTLDDCTRSGAPISGTYFESPCCKKDIHWDDNIESKEENVKETIWLKASDVLKEIKTIDKWHSTHRTLSLIKQIEDAISSNSSSAKAESFNKG
jgi:transcription initiation factor IIE alpha subunit